MMKPARLAIVIGVWILSGCGDDGAPTASGALDGGAAGAAGAMGSDAGHAGAPEAGGGGHAGAPEAGGGGMQQVGGMGGTPLDAGLGSAGQAGSGDTAGSGAGDASAGSEAGVPRDSGLAGDADAALHSDAAVPGDAGVAGPDAGASSHMVQGRVWESTWMGYWSGAEQAADAWAPLAAASVRFFDGASLDESTTSDGDGYFTLMTPFEATGWLHAHAPQYLGMLYLTNAYDPADFVFDEAPELFPSEHWADWVELAGVSTGNPAQDPARGVVIVEFLDSSSSGGEGAMLVSPGAGDPALAHDAPFVLRPDGSGVALQHTLLGWGDGGAPVGAYRAIVAYANVEPGHTAIALENASGCTYPDVSYPVVAGSYTWVWVDCS